MHYITIGLLATALMEQVWIPLPLGTHIMAAILSFGIAIVAYGELESLRDRIRQRIRKEKRWQK